jgi:acetyl-CoA carboxylase biotin carboxylase subunit
MKEISRVLVANRGEIAVRIIRACQELGIETILTVSDADRESLPAKMADRSVCIGPPAPMKSYLKLDTIVAAALGTGSDAIHPGSELVCHIGEATEAAGSVGYPVLLKAAAGGGGKGMKIVEKPEDLRTVFDEASVEALSAFGDDRIYVEHYIPNARHIEVQIIGDRFGNVVHLFERDCSLQRRYQKIVEEAPSPAVSPELREAFCEAAVRIAKQIGYENAGTVEFLLDQDQGRFYFLEMNTRIQVEHPVTEMISGIDLVKEQFRVASGDSFSVTQEEIKLTGHAIECRINAESPNAGFAPCPGRIRQWNVPEREGVRIDSHCYPGYFVPPYYDSLLAKLITWGKDRDQAIRSMQEALMDFTVSGVVTTIPFHRFIMKNPDYLTEQINTGWIENNLGKEYESDEGNQFH